MARIAGVDLPREKRVEIGLTYIFGIGLSTSRKVLGQTGISPDTRVRDLTEGDVSKLREVLDHDYKVEGDLRREVTANIKRLVDIGLSLIHISEPTRLGMISYAVFCLKKKK